MRITDALSLILLAVIPNVSFADNAVITLKDLEQEALANNPEILTAAKRAESATQKQSLASALPDPLIGYALQNVGSLSTSTVGKDEMSMQGIVVTQEVPFPGKLSTKGRAARKQAEQEQENVRETGLRVLNSLRTAYYDYYLAYKSVDILDQTKELMKNLQRIAEARYATGQGIQQDVIRAQLEVSMLLDQIAEQEQKKEAQAAQINSLVGRNPLAPLGKPADLLKTTLTRSVDELAAMTLNHSPALQSRQLMVEQNKEELSLSKREFLPDMVVSAGWFDRGGFKDVWQASVMVKVPLYFWNKSTGVKAAAADLSAARYEYEAAKLSAVARMRDLYSQAKTAEHHLHLYESGIIPQARLAFQSATTSYQVGKADFLALIESENLLLRYQLAYQEELVKLHKTLSMIEEASGAGEERNEK